MAKFIPAILTLLLPAIACRADAPATEPAWHIELLAGRDAIRRGYYAQAAPLLRSAIAEAAPDSLDSAEAVNELGKLDRLSGDYSAADQLDHQALDLRIKLAGENDPLVADSLENLGELDVIVGHYHAAEKELSQALAIRTKTFGEQNAGAAESMSNLGSVDVYLCRFDDAEKLCRRAVEIQDAVLRAGDPARADGWDNLASVEQLRSDLADAEQLYRRALDLRTAILGDDHPGVGESYDNLGGLYTDWGDPALGRRYFKLAYFIRENSLGEDHPDTAESLAAIAQGQISSPDIFPPEKTVAMLQKALAVDMKKLGQSHLSTQYIQILLGFADFQNNRLGEAEKMLTAALNASRQSFGENHFQTAHCEQALADLYTKSSAHSAEAEALYKQAISTCENLFGPDDRQTGDILQSYVEFLKSQHRDDEAAPLASRIQAIRQADEQRNPTGTLQGFGQ